ncbi:MAG: YciI family protein [Jiangellaceae bacterium]
MKYLIMMTHSSQDDPSPEHAYTPEEMKASGAHMMGIHQELAEAGELLAAEALAGPRAAKIVTSDGVNAPVVTDGVYPEAKEFLAGFWMVDVESEQRAIEIAARTSAAPGSGRKATAKPIQVWPIMTPPAPEW